MSAAFPDEVPADGARRCVFCGAIALQAGPGDVMWVITAATPPDCEHETLTGQT
jgi:hypothetical protein